MGVVGKVAHAKSSDPATPQNLERAPKWWNDKEFEDFETLAYFSNHENDIQSLQIFAWSKIVSMWVCGKKIITIKLKTTSQWRHQIWAETI